MRYEKVTFTIRYRAFDEGERVVVRETGQEAVVERFHAPSYPEDEAIVHLVGHARGIPATDCDPFLDPALPVVRTMEQGDEWIAVWIETPGGERIMYDEHHGWSPFGAMHRLGYFANEAEAVGAATSYAASVGFSTVQHHPL